MSSDKNGQQRRRTMSQMLLTVRHWGSDPWNMLWGNILAGYSGNPLGPFALSLSIEVRTNTFLYCLGKLFKQQDITKTSSSLVVHPLGHLWMSQLVPNSQFSHLINGSGGKEAVCNAGDPGSIPWVGKIPWRREWQPTPVFLPGEYHGQRSLVGYSPWGCKESDTTERLTLEYIMLT